MGPGNILNLINIVQMLIEWLWMYEYFGILRKMKCGDRTFNKIVSVMLK